MGGPPCRASGPPASTSKRAYAAGSLLESPGDGTGVGYLLKDRVVVEEFVDALVEESRTAARSSTPGGRARLVCCAAAGDTLGALKPARARGAFALDRGGQVQRGHPPANFVVSEAAVGRAHQRRHPHQARPAPAAEDPPQGAGGADVSAGPDAVRPRARERRWTAGSCDPHLAALSFHRAARLIAESCPGRTRWAPSPGK